MKELCSHLGCPHIPEETGRTRKGARRQQGTAMLYRVSGEEGKFRGAGWVGGWLAEIMLRVMGRNVPQEPTLKITPLGTSWARD